MIAMVLGWCLVGLQIYLLVVAWVHTADRLSAEGAQLLAAAVLIIALEVVWVLRHRDAAVRWKSYPVAFVGLMITGVLLAPLLLGGI